MTLRFYRLVDNQKKGNENAIKCPDIYAARGDESLVVEIERSLRPATILGDFASVAVSTHIAPRAKEPLRELIPSTVAVVVDDWELASDSTKPKQLRLLRNALAPDGRIALPWLGGFKDFLEYFSRSNGSPHSDSVQGS